MSKIIEHSGVIKVYNADKQELVGIFRTPSLVARYIYKDYSAHRAGNINGALSNKSRIKNSDMGFVVAVRRGLDFKLPDEKDFLIFNGYPEPVLSKMKGFTTSRHELWKEAVKRGEAKIKKEYPFKP